MGIAKRIILNTGFLYIKMLITMFVLLYSTRLVLSALGVEDFGLFNLVSGVVAMLSFLNAAMTVSTQRYLSYYLGAGEKNKLAQIFKTSVQLHLVVGFIIVIILETLGIFLFSGFLNIPEGRVFAAKIIFHCMVVSTFFTINAVPYDAVINSHENMFLDALVGILESFVKLAIAIYLLYSGFDKLIIYGILMAALTIIIRIIKSTYCKIHYQECKVGLTFTFDKSLIKEMFSFAGWNMFGALCGLVKGQGIAIILNIFLGTVVNAAYGIANQVNGQISKFSVNMLKALNPQIVKSEGSGDRQKMLYFSMLASKWGFFLLSFFAIPLIFEMPFVLKLWLKQVPEYTVIFCQLILIGTLTNQLTIGLQTAVQSTGKIKLYQTVVGTMLLLNLPVSYFLLKYGMPAYSTLIGFISIEFIACCFRIYFVKVAAGLSVIEYLIKVVLRIIAPLSVTIIIITIIFSVLSESFNRLVVISVTFGLLYTTLIYFIGLDKDEKGIINKQLVKLSNKLINRG